MTEKEKYAHKTTSDERALSPIGDSTALTHIAILKTSGALCWRDL